LAQSATDTIHLLSFTSILQVCFRATSVAADPALRLQQL
jgi:hypothetical protein